MSNQPGEHSQAPIVLDMAQVRRKPTWLTALGILSVVFGVTGFFSAFGHLLAAAMFVAPQGGGPLPGGWGPGTPVAISAAAASQPGTDLSPSTAAGVVVLATMGVAHLLLAIYLFIVGIGALSPWRTIGTHLRVYARTKLAVAAVSLAALLICRHPPLGVLFNILAAMFVFAGAVYPFAVLVAVSTSDHAAYLRELRLHGK